MADVDPVARETAHSYRLGRWHAGALPGLADRAAVRGDRRPAGRLGRADPDHHRRAGHRHARPGQGDRGRAQQRRGRRRCTRWSSSPACSACVANAGHPAAPSAACWPGTRRCAGRCRHDAHVLRRIVHGRSACRCVLLGDLVVRQRRQHRLLPAAAVDDPRACFPRPGSATGCAPTCCPAWAGSPSATACAVLIGVALGVRDRLEPRRCARSLEPVLEFLRAIPPPVLVPVLILFAGIGDTMKVLVIVSGCVWPVLLNTVEGVRGVDEVLADTCRSYRIGGAAAAAHVRAARGQPADRHRRPAGAVDRHHPHGDQRDERGQPGPRLHHHRVPARLPDPRDVERRAAARPASACCCRCCSGSSSVGCCGWYHGLRAAERGSR